MIRVNTTWFHIATTRKRKHVVKATTASVSRTDLPRDTAIEYIPPASYKFYTEF